MGVDVDFNKKALSFTVSLDYLQFTMPLEE